jgi:hypothetical protein
MTRSSKGDGPLTFSRLHLLGFQARLQYFGLQLVKALDAEHAPKTSAEFRDASRVIEAAAVEQAKNSIRAKRKTAKQEPESRGGVKS